MAHLEGDKYTQVMTAHQEDDKYTQATTAHQMDDEDSSLMTRHLLADEDSPSMMTRQLEHLGKCHMMKACILPKHTKSKINTNTNGKPRSGMMPTT